MLREPRPVGRAATAYAAGHFGEFLQGCLGGGGPVALVTLPCPALTVQATWQMGETFAFQPGPAAPLSRRRAARLLGALLGRPAGRLRLRWTMPPGGGAGASTAALVATARAVTTALRRPALSPAALGRLCAFLEGACDPLMLEAPSRVLWLAREGRALAPLPAPAAFDVVGGFAGPCQRTDPRDRHFADIADLVSDWAGAAARGDRRALAVLATESARRNARCRGLPPLAPLEAIAAETGALGVAAAHTGPARALLYAPGDGDAAVGAAALRALGARQVCQFRTPAR
jgi:uncharacterized protein involved in propanediol utilization